jgi:PKD domain
MHERYNQFTHACSLLGAILLLMEIPTTHASGNTVPGRHIAKTHILVADAVVGLIGDDTSMPTFTAPDVGPTGEDLTFELTVNDGHGGSKTDSVIIHVTYVNQDPVANAGIDQTRDENTVVTLDGSASTDPDGNTMHYSWVQVDGPAVINLTGTDTASPTFKAPFVDRFEDDIVMELEVTDDYGGSSTDEVTIHINNVNHPPSAFAGDNFSVQWGSRGRSEWFRNRPRR